MILHFVFFQVLAWMQAKRARADDGEGLYYDEKIEDRVNPFWGPITASLHRGMDRTQRDAFLVGGDRNGGGVLDPAEAWMKIWGVPFNFNSDANGRVLKLNIGDVDKAAAIAAVVDMAIVGTIDF